MAFVPAFAAHDKVDILFMIDNSFSQPIQAELQNRFPQLIKALDTAAMAGHPASYHIGVVDSDLGAGLNTANCKAGGDGGKLQVGFDPSGSVPPPANCANFTLTGGVRFLEYDQITGTNNVGGGLNVPDAFNCMAHVGDTGCGFQHQLESTYRALHDPPSENAGFLRDDALLVVFYLTDEDDCSAPDDTDLFVNTTEAMSMYGVLSSFRCTEFGIVCGEPAAPLSMTTASGPFDDCRPMKPEEGGKLFDVQRYIDFFTKPNGVKPDPSDVILAAIAAPPMPVGVTVTMPCAQQTNQPSCPILNHSCVAATNNNFFGDPGVRMAAVVNAALTPQLTSECETDYSDAMAGLAQKIIARLK